MAGSKLLRRVGAVLAALTWLMVGGAAPASAVTYVPVSGAGSTWAQNAIEQWRRDVTPLGLQVNFAGTGSTDGRRQFLNGTVDFAASEIPFQFHPEDNSPPENPAPGSYAYLPITAGATTFVYNLHVNGQRVTNLRLSGLNLAKIFTGVITNWNDSALAADNPGLVLPNRSIVPVVRSDIGAGTTYQLSGWMSSQFPDVWNAYCTRVGRATPCGQTSLYPTVPGMVAQSGDLGVAGYVSQGYADGAIGYANYSYALNANFPVAKVLNASGYYTEPNANNVAVSLLNAQLNTDPTSQDYLTEQLNGVYTNADQRTYPLSYYAYLIVPKVVMGSFSTAKGKALAAFSYFGVCSGQQNAAALGYAPLPINLVQAAFDQIRKIPGADTTTVTVQGCNNPTFAPDGTNTLAANAPYPQACDKVGPIQCGTITPPPAVPEGRPVMLMAVGLAVVGGWVLLRRRRGRVRLALPTWSRWSQRSGPTGQ